MKDRKERANGEKPLIGIPIRTNGGWGFVLYCPGQSQHDICEHTISRLFLRAYEQYEVLLPTG